MAKKQYTNVLDMVQDIHPEPEFQEELSAFMESRKVIRNLMVLRATKNLSQKDVADRIGCTQSKLSKLERSSDDAVRFEDLKRYAEAVDHELIVGLIPSNLSAADKVKSHVFAIKKHMDNLVDIANSSPDESIVRGVAKFFGEVMYNMSIMMAGTAQSLPRRQDGLPYFDVQIQECFGETTKETAGMDSRGNEECGCLL